jgi:hypothetical protein
VSLGPAFSLVDVSEPLYPSVGLRTLGEDITANFGQKPFLYDIDHYIKVSTCVKKCLLYIYTETCTHTPLTRTHNIHKTPYLLK